MGQVKEKASKAVGHAKVSTTIQFGLLLQVAALVQTYVDTIGSPLATMIVGIIIIGLRYKTTTSVEEKANGGT